MRCSDSPELGRLAGNAAARDAGQPGVGDGVAEERRPAQDHQHSEQARDQADEQSRGQRPLHERVGERLDHAPPPGRWR